MQMPFHFENNSPNLQEPVDNWTSLWKMDAHKPPWMKTEISTNKGNDTKYTVYYRTECFRAIIKSETEKWTLHWGLSGLKSFFSHSTSWE